MSRACILISTCDKYLKVATFTRAMIDRYWAAHPPVWLCGAGNSSGPEWLPLRNDPSDWVGITHAAVEDLIARGYRQAYLILDDHPPLGPCNEEHLNRTIPDLLDRLSAATIGLYGWDQRTQSKGQILGPDHYHLQKQDSEFLWQFSLHPALWNLEALKALLDVLLQTQDLKLRSPWAFERRSGAPDFPVPDLCRDRSYRVCGLCMLGGQHRFRRRMGRILEFRAIDLLRWFGRHLGGDGMLNCLDEWLAGEYGFFDGPYPLFWSGLLRKGSPNKTLIRFLMLRHKKAFLVEMNRVI